MFSDFGAQPEPFQRTSKWALSNTQNGHPPILKRDSAPKKGPLQTKYNQSNSPLFQEQKMTCMSPSELLKYQPHMKPECAAQMP